MYSANLKKDLRCAHGSLTNTMVPSRADNGPHFVTRDPRDPSVSWPVTRMTRDPWPSPRPWHESIMMSSRLLPSILCNLEFWICLCSKSSYKLNTMNSSLNYLSRKLCLTFYTFAPHLIMGQVFYGTEPWPIHICRPSDPWPADPLSVWSGTENRWLHTCCRRVHKNVHIFDC